MKKTPSFVCEISIKTTPHDERALDVRLNQSRQLYNACLSELLKKLKRMKQSKLWRKAISCKNKDEKKLLFQQLKQQYGFSDHKIQAFTILTKNQCAIGDHLDTHTCQKIATRAFNAVEQYMYKKKGHPRFKSFGRFRSMESKSNNSGIRFRNDYIVWNGLKLKLIFDLKDKHGVQAHALSCRTKYVRLVKKVIRGKIRWFAQLIQEGLPFIKEKNRIGSEIVGLDIGPSSIAVVSKSQAFLVPFVAEIKTIDKEIRKLQRKMDRSKRATNPKNFNPNGTIKKGRLTWIKSSRYKKAQKEVAEKQRCLAETRKRSHGNLANKVLSLGSKIKTEKLSYKAFQKLFGKSVGKRAPGLFVEKLRRKAANAGGVVEEFSTYKTKLSQTCHCGKVQKKKLSQRWHICSCGVKAQRDLYSAFLARHVKNNYLNIRQVKKSWTTAELLLRHAMLRLEQTTNRELLLSSFGVHLRRRQSGSHAERGSERIDSMDVVANAAL
jgi:putative transposase